MIDYFPSPVTYSYQTYLPESVLSQIPLLRRVRRLLEIAVETDGIKMTKIGNLPVKVVQELYPLGVSHYFYQNVMQTFLTEQ